MILVMLFLFTLTFLHVTGQPDVAYISDETPMVMYLNAHVAIDQLRHRNEREGKIGAKVRTVHS